MLNTSDTTNNYLYVLTICCRRRLYQGVQHDLKGQVNAVFIECLFINMSKIAMKYTTQGGSKERELKQYALQRPGRK